MRKIILMLLGVTLIAGNAMAGGSLFKSKHKTANVNGVYAIGVHVCSSLECPPVRIVEGKCDGEHMSQHWGVCVCDKGYVANGSYCDVCPDGQYSDGITGCQPCPGAYAATCDGSGKTLSCVEGYYADNFECQSYELKINKITDALSALYDAGIASSADTLNYTDIADALPAGCTQMVYSSTTESITLGIEDQKDCTSVKNKLGDKATGDCVASGTSTLTFRLGEANCWVQGNCTADDAEYAESYCNGGLHYEGYCPCYIATQDASMCATATHDTDYQNCRKTNSSVYCRCIAVYQKSAEECLNAESNIDSCVASGKSMNCCDCINVQGEEICAMGACQ